MLWAIPFRIFSMRKPTPAEESGVLQSAGYRRHDRRVSRIHGKDDQARKQAVHPRATAQVSGVAAKRRAKRRTAKEQGEGKMRIRKIVVKALPYLLLLTRPLSIQMLNRRKRHSFVWNGSAGDIGAGTARRMESSMIRTINPLWRSWLTVLDLSIVIFNSRP